MAAKVETQGPFHTRRSIVRIPWLVLGVSTATVGLHVAQVHGWSIAFEPTSTPDPQLDLVRYGAKSVALIADAQESWRLLSAHLVHTSWLHLLFNLAFFVPVAGALETVLRRADTLLLLFVAALGSGLASLLWTPEISAGLSGLVFAVLGAAIFVGLRHGHALPVGLRLHFGWSVLPFLVLLLAASIGNAQIDHASHFGGLVTGCVLGPWLRLHGGRRRNDAQRLVPASALGIALLLMAPAIARGGSSPTRYRFDDLAELETPAGWSAEFGPFGDVRFAGSTNLVSASLRRVPMRGTPEPGDWYEREQLGQLRETGEISRVYILGDRDDGQLRHRRFTYQRKTRWFVADVFFVDVPQGLLALTFESPADWAEKYSETRRALVGSIAPASVRAPGPSFDAGPKPACAAVCSVANSPPRP